MFSNCVLLSVACVLFSAAEDVKVLKKHTYYNTTTDEVVLETNLQEIQLEAFKDASVFFLRITGTPLDKLRKGIFSNVSIHEMIITSNNISTIEPGTFHSLHALENRGILLLSLANNKLGSVSKGVFSGTLFRKLWLFSNRISYIEPGAFDDMVHLFELDLAGNLLETVDVGVFQNLAAPALWVQLRLAENKIKFIDPYAFENTTLYALDLADNQLEPLDSNYFKNTDIGSLNQGRSQEFGLGDLIL